jgi:Arc/MetJ-type ribon-helix-helix transcriptional regulator
MEKKTPQYTTVHIPTALAMFIDELIDSGEFAYTSRSEFVKDAIRRSLETHGFYPRKPKSLLEKALSTEELQKDVNERIEQLKELRSLLVEKQSV